MSKGPDRPPPGGACERQVTTWRGQQAQQRIDWVVDEVPIALVINGISHAVMLASPADLEDFALGFALTEGLLSNSAELYHVESRWAMVSPPSPDHATENHLVECPLPSTASSNGLRGIELHLEVAASCAWRLKARRRMLAGRTGCGLCGVDSLAQVQRVLPPLPTTQVRPLALALAQQALRSAQAVQQLTGASHAAAWCDLNGQLKLLREDVGRHNALDKLIGAMVKSHADPTDGFVCITSRASFEMVQKTASAGVGLLAAVSAPSALAIDQAQTCGLALAGFVRGHDFVAYTFPERFGMGSRVD